MRMHTAVVAMYILLGDMYGTMFEEGALQAPEVAQAFQRWVCPEKRSPYISWLLHDATVTIQAIRPLGPLGTTKATDPKELLMVLAPSVGSSKGHYQRIRRL